MIDEAYKMIVKERTEYHGNIFKRWFVLGFGVFFGIALSYATTQVLSLVSSATYDRSGLEEGTEIYFKNKTWDDIAVDELVVNAYEFNSQQPRFYSKYFRHAKKGTHNVMLRTAMGGSGAAPIYFDPETHYDEYGI